MELTPEQLKAFAPLLGLAPDTDQAAFDAASTERIKELQTAINALTTPGNLQDPNTGAFTKFKLAASNPEETRNLIALGKTLGQDVPNIPPGVLENVPAEALKFIPEGQIAITGVWDEATAQRASSIMRLFQYPEVRIAMEAMDTEGALDDGKKLLAETAIINPKTSEEAQAALAWLQDDRGGTPLADHILSQYENAYQTLGTDSALNSNPLQFRQQLDIYNFKTYLNELDENGALGDLPDFDPKTDPFNIENTEYVAALNAAVTAAETAPGKILDRINADNQIPDDLQQTINAANGPQAKALSILENLDADLTEDEKAQLSAAAEFLGRRGILPTENIESPDNTSGQTKPLTRIEMLQSAYPIEFQRRTLFAQNVLRNRDLGNPETDTGEAKPDGILDDTTRSAIVERMEALFQEYASEYYTNPPRDITTSEGVFNIDENGDIYAITSVNGAEEPTREKVGDIYEGIKLYDDKDGHARIPHEATFIMLQQIAAELESQNLTALQLELDDKLSEQETRLASFFAQSELAALREEFEEALKSSGGDIDAFKQTDLFTRLQNAKENDDSALDDFLIVAFSAENRITQLSSNVENLNQDLSEFNAFGGLLGFMASPEYNPNAVIDAQNAYVIRDNILAHSAYDVVESMHGAQKVSIAVLARDEEHLKELAGRFGSEMTQSQVYAYVKEQMDIRALMKLGGEDGLTLDEVNELSHAQRGAILQKVSQAMYDGEFNPYERDMHFAYKGLEAGGPSSSNFLDIATQHHDRGKYPSGTMAWNMFQGQHGTEEFAQLDALRQLAGAQPTTQTYMLRDETIALLDGLGQTSPHEVLERIETLKSTNPDVGQRAETAYNALLQTRYGVYQNNQWRDRNPAWDAKYGEMNMDQRMNHALRVNWNKLDEIFGDDPRVMEVLYRGNDHTERMNNLNVNYDLSYNEVKTRLAQIDPALAQRLDQEIGNYQPSMYTYMLSMRIGQYRERREEYAQREIESAQRRDLAEASNPTLTETFEEGASGNGTTPEANPEETAEDTLDAAKKEITGQDNETPEDATSTTPAPTTQQQNGN